MSRADRVRALAAPALLVLVALFQVFRVHHLDQSPWSGAGFGMFATIDGESSRTVHGFVIVDEATDAVALPAGLRREAFELTVVPTGEAADDLAERWIKSIDLPEGARLELEVRGVELDDDLVLRTEVLVSGEAER